MGIENNQSIKVNPDIVKPERLKSLDILRGFDMFWITGGEGLVFALGAATGWGFIKTLEEQLQHVRWAGFHFYDLIFPLFIFIMGVAIPYALTSKLAKGIPKLDLYKKVFKRFILLVIFGIIYNQAWMQNWSDPRIASVLGQIGFAYLFAAIIFINFPKLKSIIIWTAGILVGYALIQLFVPVPGFGAGNITPEGSINAYLDQLFTPGQLLDDTFDPEGVFNNISAIAIALMGVTAGFTLKGKQLTPYLKFAVLLVTGLILIGLAMLLKDWYPIIKKAWTSTFNLQAGGVSFILLAVFYLVIDIWKINKWGFYFMVIGVNPITVYLGTTFINFNFTSKALLGGFAELLGDYEPVLISLGAVSLIWGSLYLLYKNRIFLKV